MGAHFLCCLPVRLGVLVISFLDFILSGLSAGLVWWLLYLDRDDISTRLKVSGIIFATVYTFAAIMAVVGFVGAIVKKASFVSGFSIMLRIILAFQIGSAIFSLVAFFTEPRSKMINDCIAGSTNQSVIDECNKHLNVYKVILVVAIIIPLFVTLYACHIVGAYARKLKSRQLGRSIIMDTSSEFRYQAAKSADDPTQPLTQPDVLYPYADASHSFGSTDGKHTGASIV